MCAAKLEELLDHANWVSIRTQKHLHNIKLLKCYALNTTICFWKLSPLNQISGLFTLNTFCIDVL